LTVPTRNPEVFATAMMDADESTSVFEGHPGGAWHKVIRWSFEQQGLYQPAGASTPVTQPGAPPPTDVYIDDGRNGAYMPYLPISRPRPISGTDKRPMEARPTRIPS
jgi:zinc metalloprotease ZmpB